MHSKVASENLATCKQCYGQQHASAVLRFVYVQLYKHSSEAAVTDDVDYRQVQLEQGIVHCIAMLED